MRNTLLLTPLALSFVACAGTSPAPSPAPVPAPATAAPVVTSRPSMTLDGAEFQRELQAAYESILARGDVSKPPADAPVADIEAAASIPIPEHRTIDSALHLFSVDMKDSIQTSLNRSARFKKLIDKALEEQQLPHGLAYLPVIESAYIPGLTSRAGAHGIWQFMPDTAREYGLRVDWWVDERADPERSTRAAAAYLRDLYRMFDDWPLALAAYNCGPSRVRRTLSDSGASTFWELLDQGLLPKETRGYVPTFYATLRIASDPETYGFSLIEADDIDHTRVEVRGPVSLAYIAEVVGMDAGALKEMNPSLRRGVVPPGHGSVRLPAEAAAALNTRAASLRDEDAYVRFCSFKLRKGDSIKHIARAIGTKPETILAMNGLGSAKQVGRGDSIYLPVRARELPSLLAHSGDKELFYSVRKGDTLYSIAKKHGLTVAELRDVNELPRKAVLRIGQRLRISAPRTMSAGGM